MVAHGPHTAVATSQGASAGGVSRGLNRPIAGQVWPGIPFLLLLLRAMPLAWRAPHVVCRPPLVTEHRFLTNILTVTQKVVKNLFTDDVL